MYAPVCTRFRTYDVPLDPDCEGYCRTILAVDAMTEWIADAEEEDEIVQELEMEF